MLTTFPTPTVDSVDKVMFNGVSGTYQKTITITNNSPNQVIYAFLEGQDSRQAVSPYEGTGAFDPYDSSNQEYRAYVGYTDGTNDYAGLPPSSSITITVPLAFWDSGRIIFSTDGADQFTTYGGADGGSPAGAPFYYHDTNTQATFYGSIDGSNTSQLNFTPTYNSFDTSNGGKPTTQNWQSPVASGLFQNGQSFIVTGPGLPSAGYQVTIDSSHPNDITLPGVASAPQTAQQYVFTCLPTQTISSTDRFIQGGFALAQQDAPSTTNGLVMWYHALTPQSPNNDAPFQLTEVSFRGTFYDPAINTGTGFQYLLGPDVIKGAETDSADYDISFVDTINMPIAMEASNVSIPNTNTQAPFGWVGSGQSLEDFQKAVTAFTSPNPKVGSNANSLGSYFGGQGYPSYLTIDPGDGKLPAGQNLFLASPAVGGAADIQFYKKFSDGSEIKEPLYALTSGGSGPITVSIGGDPSHPSQGHFLGLNTTTLANQYALNDLIATNVKSGHTYAVTYSVNGTIMTAGNVVGMYYAQDKTTIIGVELDQDVPADPSDKVFSFTLPQKDYAAASIAGLWYSWAKYYADNVISTAMNGVPGTISAGNILTLANPAPSLVAGMAVTGTGVPAGCVILDISSDHETIELSAVPTGNPTSFNFAKPSFASIVGFDPNPNGNTPPVNLSFNAAQHAFALEFAETIFVVMSSWSVSVPAGTPNGWDPLLVNIIGGNLGPNYLPNANTDVVNALTDKSKSALRGVPDFTSPLYSNPAQWYPDPALPAGGQTYNVFNLDPFVWLIHDKLGLTAYAFALDDDIGNVNAGGATHIDISIGGLNGLPNKDPYTNVSPWGVVTTGASETSAKSSEIAGLSNPRIVYQIAQFDYNHNTPGTLVNGPGVPMGTTAQFTQISQNLPQSKIILSNPLASSSTGSSYSFFGPLTFTGTVLGTGQATDTIVLDSPDAYNTLLKLGPLQSIQVTGEGIDPTKVVTIKQLSKALGTGVITLQLSTSLDQTLVSQPGSFYAYTFGSPMIGVVRDPGFEWANVQGLLGNFNHGAQLTQNTVDWTFTDSPTHPQTWFAGIAFNNNSDYTTGNPPAPQGLQVGFVQGDSSISQTVTLGKGEYTLSVDAAQWAKNQSLQSLNVLVDDKLVGSIEPKGTTYEPTVIRFTVGAGNHTITFQGTQQSDSTALIDAIVLGPALPPVLNAIPDQWVNEGSTDSFMAATFSSTSTLTYSLAPGAPAGATIDPHTGAFTWTPTVPGKYTVTIRVTDDGSPTLSDEESVSITVNDVAPIVTLNLGDAGTQTANFRGAGSFVDPSSGSFIASVDYGDGTGLQPLALSPSGAFDLAHTYTRPGTFTVTVNVQDSYGGVGTVKFTLTVPAVPLVSGFGRARDAFVTTLYLQDLGRLPELSALKRWSRLLAGGGNPRAVALRIWGGSEHQTLVNQGHVAPITFRHSYANALRAGRRAALLHLSPPAGPLALAAERKGHR